MLSTQHLKHLEEICERFEREGVRFGVRITTDELRQLIAAGHVANAAARRDQEERDNPPQWVEENHGLDGYEEIHPHLEKARDDLARALRLYTAGTPAGVKS